MTGLEEWLRSHGITPGGVARAEQHPLGFTAIRIRDSHGDEVRIHLWTPATLGARDSLGEVHDHAWNLESRVLVGTLGHQAFELCPGDQELWIHDYVSRTFRQLPGSWGVQETLVQQIPHGQRYQLPAGVLHRTWALTPTAVSLITAQATSRTEARILGGRPERQETHRRPVALESAVDLLFQLENSSPK